MVRIQSRRISSRFQSVSFCLYLTMRRVASADSPWRIQVHVVAVRVSDLKCHSKSECWRAQHVVIQSWSSIRSRFRAVRLVRNHSKENSSVHCQQFTGILENPRKVKFSRVYSCLQCFRESFRYWESVAKWNFSGERIANDRWKTVEILCGNR